MPPLVPANAPEFVRAVTARIFAGMGDELPVSLIPADGTFPSGTSAFEKRNISDIVPAWREDLCIQCGQCSFVCPHSVIRAKYYNEEKLAGAPASFKSAPVNARGYPGDALHACSSMSRIARDAGSASRPVRRPARARPT